MNPNSEHQTWTKWKIKCRPGTRRTGVGSFAEVNANARRFARQMFGTSGAMNVQYRDGIWIFEILVDAENSHDKQYVSTMSELWVQKFFVPGFGTGTHVDFDVKHMAGQRPSGPPDQMIIIPPLTMT